MTRRRTRESQAWPEGTGWTSVPHDLTWLSLGREDKVGSRARVALDSPERPPAAPGPSEPPRGVGPEAPQGLTGQIAIQSRNGLPKGLPCRARRRASR